MKTYTGFFLLLASVAAAHCGDDGNPGASLDAAVDDFDRGALLSNLGENVLLPTYESFALSISDLVTDTDSYCSALGTADEVPAREAAQDAWKTAMVAWQLAEVMQIGLADDGDRGLHDLIYSWPVISACAVDQGVMARLNDPAAYDFPSSVSNRRGLDSIEYLLFYENLDSLCPPQIRPEGWDVLSADERRAARCGYTHAAASDLAAQGAALVEAWQPEGGDFLGELTTAGNGSQRFASENDAVNTVFGALFYIDTVTKDQKLAQPAGMALNACNVTSEPCLDELESMYAYHSKENIAANIEGFRMLFRGQSEDGQDGSGFDDFLAARDRADLAQKMDEALTTAAAAVDTMPGSLRDALQSDYSSVTAAHAAVKAVTDPLKIELPAALDLIPPEAGGEND